MTVILALLLLVIFVMLAYVIYVGIFFIPTYVILQLIYTLLDRKEEFKCRYVICGITIGFLINLFIQYQLSGISR